MFCDFLDHDVSYVCTIQAGVGNMLGPNSNFLQGFMNGLLTPVQSSASSSYTDSKGRYVRLLKFTRSQVHQNNIFDLVTFERLYSTAVRAYHWNECAKSTWKVHEQNGAVSVLINETSLLPQVETMASLRSGAVTFLPLKDPNSGECLGWKTSMDLTVANFIFGLDDALEDLGWVHALFGSQMQFQFQNAALAKQEDQELFQDIHSPTVSVPDKKSSLEFIPQIICNGQTALGGISSLVYIESIIHKAPQLVVRSDAIGEEQTNVTNPSEKSIAKEKTVAENVSTLSTPSQPQSLDLHHTLTKLVRVQHTKKT